MPYYEYVCDDCHAQFELKRSMSNIDAPADCPKCKSNHVARQISKVAAFSHGEGGQVSSIGGSSCGCGGCSGGSCGSCGGGCGSSQN